MPEKENIPEGVFGWKFPKNHVIYCIQKLIFIVQQKTKRLRNSLTDFGKEALEYKKIIDRKKEQKDRKRQKKERKRYKN
ncbi:MAG TPA: hypothetical protein VMV49_06750 [Candidatus Deferrimicrobium sp.]|nr:hypothetical protein [Candidatus Deferrimicrobium sp.]